MNAPPQPLPAWVDPLAVPAAWLYRAGVRARNRRYDRGRNVERVDRPVISVGNLTAGGTGKTPVVDWIARTLLARGLRPAIAMRGYVPRASALDRARADDDLASDEAREHAWRLPEVPVVVGADRAAALRAFLPEHPEVDAIVLDDGFQHRRLARDLDLVLIDATQRTFRQRLLPAGFLREPPSSLARADAVILTRAREVDPALAAEVERHHGRPPLAWTRHAWTSLLSFSPEAQREGAAAEEVATETLRGRRVVAVLGVGNPAAAREQIERRGARVVVDVPARDHERYDRPRVRAIASLAAGADAIVTTGKDWVKLRPLLRSNPWLAPVLVPNLRIEFLAGEAALAGRIEAAAAAAGKPREQG